MRRQRVRCNLHHSAHISDKWGRVAQAKYKIESSAARVQCDRGRRGGDGVADDDDDGKLSWT